MKLMNGSLSQTLQMLKKKLLALGNSLLSIGNLKSSLNPETQLNSKITLQLFQNNFLLHFLKQKVHLK